MISLAITYVPVYLFSELKKWGTRPPRPPPFDADVHIVDDSTVVYYYSGDFLASVTQALLSPSTLHGNLMGAVVSARAALPQIKVNTLFDSQANYKLNNDTFLSDNSILKKLFKIKLILTQKCIEI